VRLLGRYSFCKITNVYTEVLKLYGTEKGGESNISPLKTHLRLRYGASRSYVLYECSVGELLFGKGAPHLHTTVLILRIQIGYESQNTTTPLV
jgi:hypothetical protein